MLAGPGLAAQLPHLQVDVGAKGVQKGTLADPGSPDEDAAVPLMQKGAQRLEPLAGYGAQGEEVQHLAVDPAKSGAQAAALGKVALVQHDERQEPGSTGGDDGAVQKA